MTSTLTGVVIWAALLSVVIFFVRSDRRKHPPGPKGLPIIGNLLDVPKIEPWKVYQQWGRIYGSDIVYFKLFRQHAIVLNSVDCATDLLEKRASIYSDRQASVMISELTGWGRNFGFMEYGESWRAHRRMFHQQFTTKAIPRYHPVLGKGIGRLLLMMNDSPHSFSRDVRFIIGTVLLKLVYDIDVKGQDDRNIALVEKAMHVLSLITNAGSYLVDILPTLKYVPKWFPGAEFQRQAAEWKIDVDEMFLRPFNECKRALDEGQERDCVTSSILARYNQEDYTQEIEEMLINTTGVAYAGAVDTTVTSLSTFFFVMLQYPEAQLKAQEELDRVLGQTRLPTIDDRNSLPYVTALTREVLRWHPATPLGVMHKSTADDTYDGAFIPAGTWVIPNLWAILHDERRYSSPDDFDPDRFLNEEGQLRPDVPDPVEGFGFGRRICPGRHFALDVVWLTIANVLATFVIEKPRGQDGNIIEPSGEFESGSLSPPKPFAADIKPRFAGATDLIRSSALEWDNV